MFTALTKETMCQKMNHRWKPQVESQLYDHSNNTHETGQELCQGSKRGKLHCSSESEISFMRIYALNEVVKHLQPRDSKILNCLPQLASPSQLPKFHYILLFHALRKWRVHHYRVVVIFVHMTRYALVDILSLSDDLTTNVWRMDSFCVHISFYTYAVVMSFKSANFF